LVLAVILFCAPDLEFRCNAHVSGYLRVSAQVPNVPAVSPSLVMAAALHWLSAPNTVSMAARSAFEPSITNKLRRFRSSPADFTDLEAGKFLLRRATVCRS
jgi:hypothetical protein